MIKRIFLDLDGVLRDWPEGVVRLFHVYGVRKSDIIHWSWLDEYVMERNGIDSKTFWEKQDNFFWSNLPMMPEARSVLNLVESAKAVDICLLTAPTLTSAGGTQVWIRRKLPKYFYDKRYLIGPRKEFCASQESLLIDDHEKNVDAFRDAGGHAILFPQPWNRDRVFTQHNVRWLKSRLLDYVILGGQQ